MVADAVLLHHVDMPPLKKEANKAHLAFQDICAAKTAWNSSGRQLTTCQIKERAGEHIQGSLDVKMRNSRMRPNSLIYCYELSSSYSPARF